MAPRTSRVSSKQNFAMEVPTAIGRVTSSAMVKIGDVDGTVLSVEAWQSEAYNHTIAIGELGYVVNLQADTVARGILRIVERNLQNGKIIEPEKDADGIEIIGGDREKAERVLLALRGPRGDSSSILRAGAAADLIAGEGHLIGEPIEDTSQLAWDFVSVDEVKSDTQGNVTRQRTEKKKSATASDQQIHADTYISRYHRADWQYSGDPTSPLRRVAGACREVVLLGQLVAATIMSHLPAGILKVPNELTFPGVGPDEMSGDPDDDLDPFIEALTEHLSAPISDRRSASALVPLLVSGPAEALKAFDMLQVKDTALDLGWVMELRNDALGRIATGLDVPPEVMSGKGGLNHWTGANVDADFIEKHVIPIGVRLSQFLTTSYLRRMLVVFEDMSEEDAERFELEYDASALLTRSDAAESADRLWADLLISDDARIEARGFDPDQVRVAPEERDRRLMEGIIRSASVSNKPLFPTIGFDEAKLVALGISPENAVLLLAAKGGGDDEEEAPDPAASDGIGDTPPPETGLEDPTGGVAPDESLAVIMERIRTFADAALDRALERAGNLACGKLPKDSLVTKDQIRSVRKPEILHKISDADWKKMNLSPERLLRGEWDDLTQRSVFWLSGYYESKGMDSLAADDQARRVVSEIVLQVNTRALTAFKRPLLRENGMLITSDVVLDALVP